MYLTQIVVSINDEGKWKFINDPGIHSRNLDKHWPSEPGFYILWVPGKSDRVTDMKNLILQRPPIKVTKDQGSQISKMWFLKTSQYNGEISLTDYLSIYDAQIRQIDMILEKTTSTNISMLEF